MCLSNTGRLLDNTIATSLFVRFIRRASSYLKGQSIGKPLLFHGHFLASTAMKHQTNSKGVSNKDQVNTLERLKKHQTNGNQTPIKHQTNTKGTVTEYQTNNREKRQFAFLPTSLFVRNLFGAPPPQLNPIITSSPR